MQLKLGAYLRVSTEEQVQVIEGSLESQKHRLKSFMDYKNSHEKSWGKIVEYYIEEGLSAKDTRRPQFQRMMKDIREGKINVILVTDLSRLSRNVLDFCLLLEELKKYNAKFLSVKEQFDTSTPAGEMMILNLINLAQFERKQTSERVAMNFHSRALRGFHNGGAVLLGYDKDPNNPSTLFINEAESKSVREIYRIFLEEGSIGKTLLRLEELGIKPKVREKKRYRVSDKGLWSRQTLLYLIKNPTYAGLREINKENKGKSPSDLKPWQQYQIVKAAWPAIISEETFKQAQAMIEKSALAQSQRLA